MNLNKVHRKFWQKKCEKLQVRKSQNAQVVFYAGFLDKKEKIQAT
jgi:hypothetical protein